MKEVSVSMKKRDDRSNSKDNPDVRISTEVACHMKNKVGIVIVTYNASTAVRITLASLRQAYNKTASKVLVVDNASRDLERERIRHTTERHAMEANLSWRYEQLDENLGFSGGNNAGIRAFLHDDEISHICLLNSDVIVTDYWLDRLIESKCKIVSPVTNKADSEQCIPTDYDLELDDCVNDQTELLYPNVIERVSNFAENRYRAWWGNLVESDVTFFCVLLSKDVLYEVGLLDETFFPGGYEDDDYCLRARGLGYPIHIARDVFVHHWGSASFGELRYEYFDAKASQNRAYLERKHNIVWKRRAEKPFVSYAMDVRFALSADGDRILQKKFNDLYKSKLSSLLEHFESEFRNIRRMLLTSGIEPPDSLARAIADVESRRKLCELWQGAMLKMDQFFFSAVSVEEKEKLIEDLQVTARTVHELVDCNFAMHALVQRNTDKSVLGRESGSISDSGVALPTHRPSRLEKMLWLFKRGVPFLWNFRGIVFFGGYPYPERQSDGYFQRIQIVDRLFPNMWRVYVESDELPGRSRWFDRPERKVLVLRILGGPRRRAFVRALSLLMALRCRRIYFHSVLRMHDNRFGWLMWVPFLKKVIDIHGVVPEEFRIHNDFYSAVLYEREERLAVQKSDLVVVVTEAMHRYLRQKYRNELHGRVVSFPMFPDLVPFLQTRPHIEGRPVVVYAGGLHKWQQIPKMIDAMERTKHLFYFRFYAPDPEVARAMLSKPLSDVVLVERRSHEELLALYKECHYGFILREDIVVNHVACPTKLVEYLAMGIVPIVDCADIGDFDALGLRFVTLESFLSGQVPSERNRYEMAAANFAIYESLRTVRHEGARAIRAALTEGAISRLSRHDMKAALSRLLPAGTVRGRLARRVWRVLPGHLVKASLRDPSVTVVKEDLLSEYICANESQCDVLVQVGNFEAGGLENMTLEINEAITSAGFRVVLLVLGTAGAAAERARKKATRVITIPPKSDAYRTLLKKLQPKLVLTHYSTFGLETCSELHVPIIQVIHNTYMWFDEEQLREFSRAATFTDVFVAVSEYAKNYTVSRLGVDEKKCVVIPNGIDVTRIESMMNARLRQQMREEHGYSNDDFVFLSIGAINHQKNHLATLRAFAAISVGCPSARLIILGPAYEKQLLEEMNRFIVSSGLQQRVQYAGASTSADAYYAMADAFVTATFFEGGPLTLLEAIVANVPVIMPNVGVAMYFRGRPGIEIIEPAFDICQFRGRIWEMVSTPDFEERLAAAMVRTYRTRQKPSLDEDVRCALDKQYTHRCYVELVKEVLNGEEVRKRFADTWPDRLLACVA